MWRWLVNVVLFKAAWIACALACAAVQPPLALAAVSVVVGVHLACSTNRSGVAALLIFAGLLGTVIDTLLIALGAVRFPGAGWLPPLAFVCFWINYATLQTIAMRPLVGHWLLVSLLGLLGGPAAYFAGARLEALSLPSGAWPGLLPVGLSWAIAAPLLLWVSARLTDHSPQEGEQPGAPHPPVEEFPTHAG